MQETSTEKLQESEVQIVPSDICTQKMKSTDIEDNLIVCAGGNKKGPCKVITATMSTLKLAFFCSGGQWWTSHCGEGQFPCPDWDHKHETRGELRRAGPCCLHKCCGPETVDGGFHH